MTSVPLAPENTAAPLEGIVPFREGLNLGLFGQIIRHIQRVPEKLNMSDWAATIDWKPEEEYNMCNTQACIAGWAVLLNYQPGDIHIEPNSLCYGLEIDGDVAFWDDEAQNVLGLTQAEADRLFLPNHWPASHDERYRCAQDSAEKGEAAIRRIKHFIGTGE